MLIFIPALESSDLAEVLFRPPAEVLWRLQLPPSLFKCLGTTNVIERPQSGVQKRRHNVTRWRTGEMVERWVASSWLLTEKHFRKVVGHRDLWALAVVLGRERKPNASSEKVA